MPSPSSSSKLSTDENDVLVKVEGVSKKFCRDLKKSLWYGMCDIASEILPFGQRAMSEVGRSKLEDRANQEIANGSLDIGAAESTSSSGSAAPPSSISDIQSSSGPAALPSPISDIQSPPSNQPDDLRPGEFYAVRDVSFELRRGECLGLIGRNGAGKTTLLKMLNGLIKPDHGRITMKGRIDAGFKPDLLQSAGIDGRCPIF